MQQLVLSVPKKTKHKLVYFFFGLIITGMVNNFLVTKNVLIIRNEGISFGQQVPLILFFEIVFCAFTLGFFLKEKSIGLMMITIGGMINLSDRLRFGFVRDYWNLGGSGIYNNINDWIISFGVMLFLIEIIWKKLK